MSSWNWVIIHKLRRNSWWTTYILLKKIVMMSFAFHFPMGWYWGCFWFFFFLAKSWSPRKRPNLCTNGENSENWAAYHKLWLHHVSYNAPWEKRAKSTFGLPRLKDYNSHTKRWEEDCFNTGEYVLISSQERWSLKKIFLSYLQDTKKKSEIFKDQKTQRSLEGKCYHYGKIIPPLYHDHTQILQFKEKTWKSKKAG